MNTIQNKTGMDSDMFLDYLLRLKRVQEKHMGGISITSKKRQAKINETRNTNTGRSADNNEVLGMINKAIIEHEKAAKQ